jgi:DNA-binding response OmpR family regulator
MQLSSKSSPGSGSLVSDRPRTVLVVDDEPMIRDFLVMILQLAGYKVCTAESGSQALAVAGAHEADGIDLLITDLGMPGMTGPELAAELRALQPGIKTLFISGDSSANLADLGFNSPECGWLPKPFGCGAVRDSIRLLFASEPASI